MDNIVIMAFTEKGYNLSVKVRDALMSVENNEITVTANRVSGLNKFIDSVYNSASGLVFVGAAGIAVRAVAGRLRGKTKDPAVIVIDELGKFVIPILSGHIGGANELSLKIAAYIGAIPVITTATDINGIFSIDAYAAKNGYAIKNPECIKNISAHLLAGKEVGLYSDFKITGALPKGFVQKQTGDVGVYIGFKNFNDFKHTLTLIPKCIHVGVGSQKNANFEHLNEFFTDTLKNACIPVLACKTISSIDLKKNERAIISLADKYNVQFITYPAAVLNVEGVNFNGSEFVKEVTGVYSVCEAAAYVSSQRGERLVEKTAKKGMTIAAYKEAWEVCFIQGEYE